MKNATSCFGKSLARLVIALVLLTWVGLMLACVEQRVVPTPPPPKPAPVSKWGDRYSYRYDPPASKAAAAVKATIIVVNPSYREEDSALANPTYLKVGKGFVTSMGVDMDKVIIAKGMTSKGPFSTNDDITYSDKKMADLALVPKVFITTEVRFPEKWLVEENFLHEDKVIDIMSKGFEMRIGGWISFVMQEPMSGQKMWIKRLELPELTVKGRDYYKAIPQYDTKTYTEPGFLFAPPTTRSYTVLVGHNPGEILVDGKKDAMADAIKEFYPIIMEKCWTYIDTDEIISLKEKVKEIRELKRF